MNLFEQNGYWWVNFNVTVNGKQQRKRKPTGVRIGGDLEKAEASRKAGNIVQDALTNVPSSEMGSLAPSLSFILKRTYAEHWSRQKQHRIIARTVFAVSRDIGGYTIDAVDYGVLQDYATRMTLPKESGGQGLAPATVNRRMSAVSFAMAEAVRRKEIAARPEIPRLKENNKKERYLSVEEEAAALKMLDQQMRAADILQNGEAADWQYLSALIVFLLDTGFRFSEAYKFQVLNGKACLSTGDTKNDKGRQVPLTARALAAARALLAHPRHTEFAPMVAADATAKAAWDWVSYRWYKACKLAGIEAVTLHTLRHTCASRLVQRGVSLYVVKEWLGHSSITVTERYAHLASDSLSGALSALEGRPVLVSPIGESSTSHAMIPLANTL